MPFMIHHFLDSDKYMDPCYILAKYTNQLGEGKLKWDDEKNKLVCFDDGSEPEKYSCNLETESPNIDYTCGMHDVVVTFLTAQRHPY